MNTHAKMTSPKSPITAFHVKCFDDVPTSVGSGNTSGVLSPLVQTCYSEYVETRREAHRVTGEEPSSSLPASCAWNLQPNIIKTSIIYRQGHNKIILFNFLFVFHTNVPIQITSDNRLQASSCLNIYLRLHFSPWLWLLPSRIHTVSEPSSFYFCTG